MTKITIDSIVPNNKTFLTPEIFPEGSCFIMFSELFQVISWHGDSVTVFDFAEGHPVNLALDRGTKHYEPVSEVNITYNKGLTSI